MLTRKGLDDEIRRIEKKLSSLPVESKDYDEYLGRLERLRKMRTNEKTVSSLSPGDILKSSVLMTGWLIVCNSEYVHPITTKVFTMLPKLRF